MRLFHLLPIALLPVVLLVPISGGVAAEVRVAAEHLNLRAAPHAEAEVVGQVARGDILTAGETQGDWLQVVPPPTVVLWVYSELIRDGEAAASKVLVRAGPGINYRDVGQLAKGDKVTVKGASASGEWLRIVPPPGCALWISGKYVEPVGSRAKIEPAAPVPGAPAGRPPKAHAGVSADKPNEKPVPAEDRGTRSIEPPPGLGSARLADRAGQGQTAQYEGVLGGSGFVWRRPTPYRLIQTDTKGHIVSACYVLGDEPYLSTLKGKTLLVYGREYWVQGVQYPVVAAEQIILRD